LDVAIGATSDERSSLVTVPHPSSLFYSKGGAGLAATRGMAMISLLIGILIICVVGAICFWAIDKFVRDGRLANLLKLLVVLICLAAILQRVLPLAGIGGL
jgi:hypothetical protein